MSSQNVRAASSDDIRKGEMFSTTVDGTKLLLSRVDGEVKGVIDKCTHLGMPMRKGKFAGTVITCPFHGSRFDIATGENLDWVSGVMGAKMPKWACKIIAMGKQPAPLTTLTVEERDGAVFVSF
jgi:nitrite reductase/ring-hydroxylating ferredoxin subunit